VEQHGRTDAIGAILIADPEPLPSLESPIAVSIPRSMNRLVARLLVGVLVLAQVALSAYACPVMPAGSASGMATATMAGEGTRPERVVDGMPAEAWRLDPAQPNLCAAHCQSGQQNVDGKPASSAPPALPAGFYPAVQWAPLAISAPAPAWLEPPSPAASPPLAILHCCFRI